MMTIEENKKRLQRTNLLLILFLCLMSIGVTGSVYYYHETKKAKVLVQTQKDSVEVLKTNLESLNTQLLSSKLQLEQKTTFLDSIMRVSVVEKNYAVLAPVIKSTENAKQLAAQYEGKGYAMLEAGNLEAAKELFYKSENAYNGYHQVYEIYFLLFRNRQRLNDPAVKERLLAEIALDYSRFKKAK